MAAPTKKKWNVIFLVYAELAATADDLEIITKNNTNYTPPQDAPLSLPAEIELTYLFNDIIDAGNSPDVNVFVIYNRVDVDAHHDWTSLYLLQHKDDNGLVLQRIRKVENTNITKPGIIITLFKETDKISQCDHRMLFTWDHGAIYGIFKQRDGLIDKWSRSKKYQVVKKHIDGNDEIVVLKGNQAYDRAWDEVNEKRAPFIPNACDKVPTVSPNQLINEILTNEELTDAITDGFDNYQTDILIMMNCSMMNVNTTYALYRKNAVRYLIAPQSEINFPTFNYQQILTELYANTRIKPFLLSRYIIQTLTHDRKYPRDSDFFSNMQFWAILCVDVRQYAKIIFLINELILELTYLITTDKKTTIKDNLNCCYRFDSYRQHISDCMIDIRTFLFLCKGVSDKLYELHCDFEDHLNTFIVDSFIGPCLFPINNQSGEFRSNLRPSGVSIFFPRNRSFIHPDIFQSFIAENALSRSSFFSDIKWLDFICKYISH